LDAGYTPNLVRIARRLTVASALTVGTFQDTRAEPPFAPPAALTAIVKGASLVVALPSETEMTTLAAIPALSGVPTS
jgi:hypothetical protein